MTRIFRGAVLAVALLPAAAQAQGAKSFRARLSPVPMDLAMAATIAGSGSVTATLNGSKLSINGTFDGLKSPATVARLHRGQRGVRGEPILELTVTKATSGTITANLDLTSQHVDMRALIVHGDAEVRAFHDGREVGRNHLEVVDLALVDIEQYRARAFDDGRRHAVMIFFRNIDHGIRRYEH